jgi:hypothetical protein
VQLCIFKARLTKIEKFKDVKHEYENSRKLQETHKKAYSFSKYVHAFFINMIAEKLCNKNFYALRFGFGFDKISCS